MNFTKKLLFLAFIFSVFTVSAQDHECGTDNPTAEQLQVYKTALANIKVKPNKTNALLKIPITAHIIRKSNGSGGYTVTELNTELDTVNAHYKNANIEFFVCGIDYIDDDNYYSFQKTIDEVICIQKDVANTVNIYFANEVWKNTTSGTSYLCGYAYLPGGPDRLIMDNSCAVNGSTLAHELGHFFDLLHTHNGGGELVDGTNCSTDGDYLCDTPADPTLSYSTVNSSCIYTGIATDANNDAYNPDVTNIMSYSRKSCRYTFSTEQLNLMDYTAQNVRTGFTCASSNSKTLSSLNTRVYPQPAANSITIESEKALEKIEIYDLSGKIVLTKAFENNLTKNKVDVSGLKKGVYLLNIFGQRLSDHKKITILH